MALDFDTGAAPALGAFELPRAFVGPALRALRLANTALDGMFYDVGVLTGDLLARGEVVVAGEQGGARMAARLDLSAMTNPEGCILIVDAEQAPFVTRFDRVDAFIAWASAAGSDVHAVSITGVGSSALGSAAFAWNVSKALRQRVAAIVPGYGVADAMGQALGGWFGFGMREWVTAMTQAHLAVTAPRLARVGHALLESAPGWSEAGPGFQTGSAASDVLHALLRDLAGVELLVGHSKGALAIGNALLSLPAEITRRLSVTTFGCPIAQTVPVREYRQFLGTMDFLGWLNSWGNAPSRWLAADHGTNTQLPMSMGVTGLEEG